MFDLALMRELAEMIGKSLTYNDIQAIGNDIFRSYDTHQLEGVAAHVSISPLNAARRLVAECQAKGKLKELTAMTIQLDGNLLNGRTVELANVENLLFHLTQTGIYFDFDRRRFVDFDRDKQHLVNWGTLKDGREYPLVVASVDICDNSSLVKKHKPRVMEKVYYELWEHLLHKLAHYDGRIWSWAGDGGIVAFRGSKDPSPAVRCLFEVLLSLPAFNLRRNRPIKDDIVLRVGVDAGNVKFYRDTGRIVSDVVNYAAHLEKKGTKPSGLSVSDAVHSKLPAQLKKLFSEKHEFEGRTAYSMVFDVAAAIR